MNRYELLAAFPFSLFVVLLILRKSKEISCSWWLVMSPLWLSVFLIIAGAVVSALAETYSKPKGL